MQDRASLDVVVRSQAVVRHLLSSENQTLLCWRDTLLLFDTLLDTGDLVIGLDIDLNLQMVKPEEDKKQNVRK